MRKRPKEYLKNLFKTAGMGAIVLVAFYIAGFWVTQFSTNSQASQEKINVVLAPKKNAGAAYGVDEIKNINLILKPKSASKGISAFKVAFVKDGVLDIVGFGEPSVYPNTGETQSDMFAPVEVDSNSFTYVVTAEKSKELPSAVRVSVQIKGSKKGDGKLKINKIKSSVVGNVPGSEYEFGNVDEGNYKFK